jgi:hypothetical protein
MDGSSISDTIMSLSSTTSAGRVITPPASGVTEAASEIQSSPKRKRGRPPTFDAKSIATYQMLGMTVCRRTAVDGIFSGIGMRVLGADDHTQLPQPFAWLTGKQSVLAQIGRLFHETDDADYAREIASLVCANKLKAKIAVARLRQVRSGKGTVGDADQLHARLARLIDDYTASHGDGMAPDQILDAINSIHNAVDLLAERRQAA